MGEKLVFSNAILEGYLKFAKTNLTDIQYKEFISEIEKDEQWLFDKYIWHDSDFMDKLCKTINRFFPNINEIGRIVTRFLYEQKKYQRFSSLLGLLLAPENIIKKLPDLAKSMNLYNTFRIISINKNLISSKVCYRQYYREPEKTVLNAHGCDSSVGSIEGISKYLGYKLLEIKHNKCIKDGDEYCEYEITWLKKTIIGKLLFSIFTFAAMYSFFSFLFIDLNTITSLTFSILSTSSILFLCSAIINKRKLSLAFEYQQELLSQQKEKYSELTTVNNRILEYQKQINEVVSLSTLGEHSFHLIHEIATPINIITFCTAEIAKDLKDGTGNKEKLLHLTTQAELGSERILKMIKFYRTIVRGMNPKIIKMDVIKAIHDCIELVSTMMNKNRVIINKEINLGTFEIEVFEGFIETIILNILQNAKNALMSIDDQRTITFKVEQIYEDDQDKIKIDIGNNGPAIPESFIEKIWNRFGTSTVSTSGSGFGLYNVRKMVEKIGGAIYISTGFEKNGAGTNFKIIVPRKTNTITENNKIAKAQMK